MPTPKEILEELIQDPELKKYPHSYNPIIIERAERKLSSYYKSQEVKRLGVEGIYDVIMQVMKKYLLNKKSNWNVVPVKEIAQAIVKAQEELK